jgi:hypothetical protein
MKPRGEVTVRRADLVAAVRVHLRKRGPRGTRRNTLPQDTLIYTDTGALVVDTPTNSMPLPMEGYWPVCISVSARSLMLVCPKLRLVDRVSLIFAAGRLILDGGAFVLPAIEAVWPPPRPSLDSSAPAPPNPTPGP